ncbi:MAG: aldehyde dehydrogenase family protein [Deltaproteobacteria bacterium]|nr:aldehyde dehydrogenase family protein [Deltaproteobacteria bacterium]MBW2628596.1 aldehyde dehydrogenase family protein [Deltaproteobacteria bacterium]
MPELQLVSTPSEHLDGSASGLVGDLRAHFQTGTTRPLSWRLSQLDALEHFLMEREQDIFAALRADLGKPITEAFTSEIGMTLSELRLTRKKLASWMKPERVRTPWVAMPGRSYVYREPLGVTLIIGAWNYPVSLVVLPLIGAIAAGNCVVLKPSELAPNASALLAKWIPKYLDRKSIRVVEGGVPETTALLREKWDHIFYTGSGTVGSIVMQAAAKHLTPVTLELGGKSPCIVDESANLNLAAKRIVYGKFFNAGQTCVAPDYVLVHEHVHDALLNRIVSTIREFYGDDPKQSPDYARIVNERHHARLTALLSEADVVTGGQSDVSDRYIAPTILKNVNEDDAVMQEEIFGPILPVISVPSIESAIGYVGRRAKPLALYVFARDEDVQDRVLAGTSAGGTTLNHIWIHLGVPALPFGGVGGSGMGAYHGRHSFEAFSHRRAVLKKPAMPDPPILFPPYSARKLRWIKRLL